MSKVTLHSPDKSSTETETQGDHSESKVETYAVELADNSEYGQSKDVIDQKCSEKCSNIEHTDEQSYMKGPVKTDNDIKSTVKKRSILLENVSNEERNLPVIETIEQEQDNVTAGKSVEQESKSEQDNVTKTVGQECKSENEDIGIQNQKSITSQLSESTLSLLNNSFKERSVSGESHQSAARYLDIKNIFSEEERSGLYPDLQLEIERAKRSVDSQQLLLKHKVQNSEQALIKHPNVQPAQSLLPSTTGGQSLQSQHHTVHQQTMSLQPLTLEQLKNLYYNPRLVQIDAMVDLFIQVNVIMFRHSVLL